MAFTRAKLGLGGQKQGLALAGPLGGHLGVAADNQPVPRGTLRM